MNSVSILAPKAIQTPKPKVKENDLSIANPASVFCEENGGKLEIITAEDGSQNGMCKFSDGSQCEEWKFYRGECPLDDSQKEIDISDWQTFNAEKEGVRNHVLPNFRFPKNWRTTNVACGRMVEVIFSDSDIDIDEIDNECLFSVLFNGDDDSYKITKTNLKTENNKIICDSIITQLEKQIPGASNSITDWQTYQNEKYGYSIKYDPNWIFEEFSEEGASFSLSDGTQIIIRLHDRPFDYKDLSFEEYVLIAGNVEIQNFESLASIEKITTKNNIIGYKTRWNVSSMADGSKLILSSPIIYFNSNNTSNDIIELGLNCLNNCREDMLDIMALTFDLK